MRRAALILAVVAVATAQVAGPARAAAPQDPAVASGLVRSAWYWQARARDDKAEEAWKQVLAADPDHAEALAALGGFHARAGRAEQAREALARLEKVSPGHPDVPVLRRQLELGTRLPGLLAAARKLVHEGKTAEGVARYRTIFGNAGPPGDLALEYYQTLGGTDGGFDEARDGLRRLVRRAPAEARIRLVLARLLTYRDATRREGIQALAELARDRSVSKDAVAAWRQALLWLAPTAAEMGLLRAYLRAHPDDAELARRLERGQRAGSLSEAFAALDRGDLRLAERLFRAAGDHPEAKRGLALLAQREALLQRKAGFAALERGDLQGAEELFRAAGDDADARLGLALVAQRQALAALRAEEFGRARDLLERARRLAPQRSDLWAAPLRTAAFWALMREGEAARVAGRADEAAEKLRAARQRAPDGERWRADLALGDVEAARRRPEPAEAHYRDALAASPDQPDALRGLASVLVAAGRFEEALPVNERLERAAPGRAFRPGWLRAEGLRAGAARARQGGDLARARSDLAAARQADPQDAWVLHDLANVLLEAGAVRDAREALGALLQLAPAAPEARATEARVLAAEGRSAEALQALSRLPATVEDPSLAALRRRLEVEVRVPALLDLAARGGRDAAVRELAALERQVAAEPQLAGSVALAWSRLGEHGRAVALMRSAVARAPTATRGLRLELAAALLQAGDDAAVASLLTGLERDTSLSAGERRWLADLRVALAVRSADRARERGDEAAAGAALGTALRDQPDDPRLLAALARLLEPRDAARAHALYRRVLSAAPDDLEALRGAVDTALALGDAREARALAAEAARRHPRDARAHVLVGRTEARAGDDAAAMRSLERAHALLAPAAYAAVQPGGSAAVLSEGAARPAALAAPDPGAAALRGEIGREMERVRDRHRPALDGVFEARSRDGEPGLGALLELRQSVEGGIPVGYDGHFTFRATAIELDAGAVGRDAAARFGNGAGGPARESQRVAGTELRAGYEGRWLGAWLATTPLGFPVQTLLGGGRLRLEAGAFQLAVEGARRSVFESLLSYAGTRDPESGRSWGGVVMDGGRLELAFAPEGARVWAFGGWDRLLGFRVADNQRALGGGGAEVRLGRGAAGELTVGLAAQMLGYERNLRYFTLGHGGYFSPQRLARATLPVGWRGATSRVRWEVVAEPGVERFEEDSAPVFPLGDPAGGTDPGPYPGQTTSGFTLDARAGLGLTIAGALEVGLSAALQAAPEYREVRGAVVLRWGGAPTGPAAAGGRW